MIINRSFPNPPSMTLTHNANRAVGADKAAGASQPTTPPSDAKAKAQQALSEALEKARNSAKAVEAFADMFSESRKDSARQRIDEIRETIRILKQFIMLFGGKPPKGLLKQLQQLARDLNNASSELKESGTSNAGVSGSFIYSEEGTGPFMTQAVPTGEESTMDAESQGDQSAQALVAQAESELASLQVELRAVEEQKADTNSGSDDGQAHLVFSPPMSNGGDAQRRTDAELIAKALQELKELVDLVKAGSRGKDPEADKQYDNIDKQLASAEKAVQALRMPSLAVAVPTGISVRV
ncbi:hypothetical protein CAI21_07240 [Alkalilimnicola ehrlichii]|uniref:Uncharacterized protein n=1 Tax=Alkalilimnicola ehrlichii TaxID=351052 RepID=A0A3E0WWH8_9GAMM|nr:hypothetical protein [Alkalilimnicola ehrlichii]RFA30008.1 hypothetical protein CAI21_07240 [Alkalilimnicola ehrlichii]RFA37354.1 hypothetical protein CAL65_08580 [Alkalilimnicola ehrlichii]